MKQTKITITNHDSGRQEINTRVSVDGERYFDTLEQAEEHQEQHEKQCEFSILIQQIPGLSRRLEQSIIDNDLDKYLSTRILLLNQLNEIKELSTKYNMPERAEPINIEHNNLKTISDADGNDIKIDRKFYELLAKGMSFKSACSMSDLDYEHEKYNLVKDSGMTITDLLRHIRK